jgi:4-carboxymuconolactone decarboxylase
LRNTSKHARPLQIRKTRRGNREEFAANGQREPRGLESELNCNTWSCWRDRPEHRGDKSHEHALASFVDAIGKDRVMAKSELYVKGEAIRKSLMGEVAFARRQAEYHSDPAMKKFIDVATETVFGSLWTRPGLDIKTRTLICVVSDAATGRHPELDIHLRFALREGWTEEQLVEVLLHLTGYVGVPIIREAMLVASKVFAEIKGEGTSKG